jgi:Holliday junction resolvase RusA-like endonuclease
MTQADKWKKRKPVVRYFEYANRLKIINPAVSWEPLSLHFVLPMPKSWSKKKREAMKNKPHTQKPDLDNLVKAFKDALLAEDSDVWMYKLIMKTWGEEGCIIVNPKLRPVSTSFEQPEPDNSQQQSEPLKQDQARKLNQ